MILRKRAFAVSILLGGLAATGFAQQTSATQTGRGLDKPNIVYFFADDLGYGEVGAYGQKKIHTPNMDKLAEQGMKFTRHYVGTPVCAPSRCNLLTGLHSGHAVVRGNYEFGGYTDETEGGQMAGSNIAPARR